MYEYFQGEIVEKNPAYMVLDCNGIGYVLNISIHTYENAPEKGRCKLYVHQVIKEDAHVLYGFAGQEERFIFRQLISVSGVGAATARVILSSMSPGDIQRCIINGEVSRLKAVKGIGEKTAQRIIVDLKTKLGGQNFVSLQPAMGREHNKIRMEALNALETLGYARNTAEKAVDKIIRDNDNSLPLEELVKRVLKNF